MQKLTTPERPQTITALFTTGHVFNYNDDIMIIVYNEQRYSEFNTGVCLLVQSSRYADCRQRQNKITTKQFEIFISI